MSRRVSSRAARSRNRNVSSPTHVGMALYRATMTVLVLALILYVAALVLSRTDGFRSIMEERVRDRWQWPVQVTAFRVTPRLNLEARGIETDGMAAGNKPGLRVERVLWVWTWKGVLHPAHRAVSRVEMEGAQFVFQADPAGVMQPARFAAMARDLAQRVGFPPEERRSDPALDALGLALHWDKVDVYWLDGRGSGMGALHGVTYSGSDLALPGHDLRYHRLFVDTVVRPDGGTDRDVLLEWFLLDGEHRWMPISRRK